MCISALLLSYISILRLTENEYHPGEGADDVHEVRLPSREVFAVHRQQERQAVITAGIDSIRPWVCVRAVGRTGGG